MAKTEKRVTLSGMSVSEAMRRQVVNLSQHAAIDKGINFLIKHKINALLTTDENNRPVGVVSKTDIMGAYYAGLPLETPMDNIMSSPPLFCRPEDSLESALNTMRSNGVYRLYVLDDMPAEVAGALAYPDIVGLLYRYCYDCGYSRHRLRRRKQTDGTIRRYRANEVMTSSVKACMTDDSLVHVMEKLSEYRFGAMLINDENNVPRGVVSKTDLALSYKHGVDARVRAGSIMSIPVRSCREGEYLEDAVQKMIFADVHRLFVYKGDPDNIVGVLSLSDAARIRSGSCHACVSSRIKVDDHT